MDFSNAAVRDEHGQFLFAFGMVSDITAQKRAAGLLEESERKYRSLFEAAPVEVSIVDANRIVLDANPAFARMVDLPKDELVGMTLSGFVEPRSVDESATTFGDLVAGRADTDRQQRRWLASRTGVEWVEFTNSAVRDDSGEFLYGIVVWQDITERLRAERQLAASERKYRSLFEAAPAGVVILDRDRNITEMKPAFQHMAAIAGDEIHGRRTSEFVGRPDADPTAVVKGSPGGRTLFDDLIDGTVDQAHQERRWIAPGSDIESVEFHNSAVRDDNGEFLYAIGITRDITPRRRAEQER